MVPGTLPGGERPARRTAAAVFQEPIDPEQGAVMGSRGIRMHATAYVHDVEAVRCHRDPGPSQPVFVVTDVATRSTPDSFALIFSDDEIGHRAVRRYLQALTTAVEDMIHGAERVDMTDWSEGENHGVV